MNNPPPSLPPAVAEALARGKLIEAVKLLRSDGIGLKQARDAVAAHARGQHAAPEAFSAGTASPPLPANVLTALQQGQKIEAIRLMRAQSGLDLKHAREAVEAYERARAPTMSELSPGQVSETVSWLWRVVTLALVALAVFLILRRLF